MTFAWSQLQVSSSVRFTETSSYYWLAGEAFSFSCLRHLFFSPQHQIWSGSGDVGLLGSYLPLSPGNPHGVLFTVLHAGFTQSQFRCPLETFLVSMPVVMKGVPLVPTTTLPLSPSQALVFLILLAIWLAPLPPPFCPILQRWLGFFPSGLSIPVNKSFSCFARHQRNHQGWFGPSILHNPSGIRTFIWEHIQLPTQLLVLLAVPAVYTAG